MVDVKRVEADPRAQLVSKKLQIRRQIWIRSFSVKSKMRPLNLENSQRGIEERFPPSKKEGGFSPT